MKFSSLHMILDAFRVTHKVHTYPCCLSNKKEFNGTSCASLRKQSEVKCIFIMCYIKHISF